MGQLINGIILIFLCGWSEVLSQRDKSHENELEDPPSNNPKWARLEENILKAMSEHFKGLKEEIKSLRTQLNGKYEALEQKISALPMEIKKQSELVNSTLPLESIEQETDAFPVFEEYSNPLSCKDLVNTIYNTSGVYKIQPNKAENISIQVYCDMDEEGGGWTLIQRRGFNFSNNDDNNNTVRIEERFNRTWEDFKRGFGSAHADYWIGLKNLASLTTNCENELMTTLTRWDGTLIHTHHSSFTISGGNDTFELKIGDLNPESMGIPLIIGNVPFVYKHELLNNRLDFRFFNSEYDAWVGVYCVLYDGGVWWYGDGCTWMAYSYDEIEPYKGANSTFMKSEMKIRSKC